MGVLGSKCISCGVYVQAHLSDAMRQGLVALNVLHARDLDLQSRIACDDDRILQAVSRRNPASAAASPAGAVHLLAGIFNCFI